MRKPGLPAKESTNSAINDALTSIPTYSIVTPDMTSPATSDRHLSTFVKTAEDAASYGLVSNFISATFCLPYQLACFLFWYCDFYFSENDVTRSRRDHGHRRDGRKQVTCESTAWRFYRMSEQQNRMPRLTS